MSRGSLRERLRAGYDRLLTPILRNRLVSRLIFREHLVREEFFRRLISRTRNFGDVEWLGQPIWQNVLDLWTIQETIHEVGPELLIESGTNRGGSARFYAHLFDLLGRGRVVTIDMERMHDLSHPRISFLIGSSTSDEVVAHVRREAAGAQGPIMVILDSNHSMAHVRRELELYAPLVTPGSFCLVQDGVIDTLEHFAPGRPGPLPAIEDFLRSHPEFMVDRARCERFLISHHPRGWLRRQVDAPGPAQPGPPGRRGLDRPARVAK